MSKKMNYAVIGGQYEMHYYGACETLIGAKRIATRNEEYWDNWQGWHKPVIYAFEDTYEWETKGMITYRDGIKIRIPKYGAREWRWNGVEWIENRDF